jgi:hypothetical protein
MALANWPWFKKLPQPAESVEAGSGNKATESAVTVCIPARNEAANIGPTLEAVLASQSVHLKVLVGDDHSEDATASIVREKAEVDNRLQLVCVPPLAPGWNGKQHALHHLANLAQTPLIAFIDADVRLEPHALNRLIRGLQQTRNDLVSGFPRQLTGCVGEALLVPHIQFVLTGFLPFFIGHFFPTAAFAAGCGQCFVVRRSAYVQAGGHTSLKGSAHDGLRLPKAFRKSGLRTGVFDASDAVACRMYQSFAEAFEGLGKNATEGMAAKGAIGPFTVLLGLGQVAPALGLIGIGVGAALGQGTPEVALPLALALCLSTLNHLWLALRFRQSVTGALIHPLGILCLLSVQWLALFRKLRGQSATWKGRQLDG